MGKTVDKRQMALCEPTRATTSFSPPPLPEGEEWKAPKRLVDSFRTEHLSAMGNKVYKYRNDIAAMAVIDDRWVKGQLSRSRTATKARPGHPSKKIGEVFHFHSEGRNAVQIEAPGQVVVKGVPIEKTRRLG